MMKREHCKLGAFKIFENDTTGCTVEQAARLSHSKSAKVSEGAARKLLNATSNTKLYGSLDDEQAARAPAPGPASAADASVADIIGSFGWFQLMVLLFSGLREGSVGYDAVVMSIVLRPETNFRCADEGGAFAHHDASNSSAQCYRWLRHGAKPLMGADGEQARCESWSFQPQPAPKLGQSLVAEWSLVCDRHWLVAFVESAYFLGLVTGNLTWGYLADRIGRRRAYLLAHTLALVAGWASLLAPDLQLFVLCRFLSAFGAIGYNVIYSIQVELIGTEHRAFSTTMNHLGWGLGVILVPFADRHLPSYHYLIAVAPILSLLMYPWSFWLPESPRWLMAHGKFEQAREQLARAADFNGKSLTGGVDKKITLLMQKVLAAKGRRDSITEKQSYGILFADPRLFRDTALLAFISLSGHLFYYLLTINFAYMDNLSGEANFIISGAGEWVSVVLGAILLKFFSRRACMSLCLAVMTASFILQSVIDSKTVPSLNTELVITTNNGLGTVSSLLLIFITLIVNQEVYPTIIRQRGSSIVNTLGESGSALSPLVLQLGHLIGHWRTDILYTTICLLAMVGAQFITKTDHMDLSDN